MPDVDVGEATIHYEQAGDGSPAYVYCHGLGGSGQGFEENDMAWYAERFRTISWDNRGLGRSGPAAKYSLPRYASDLDALLAAPRRGTSRRLRRLLGRSARAALRARLPAAVRGDHRRLQLQRGE